MNRYTAIIILIISLLFMPSGTNAQTMANYTAEPPFVSTSGIEPNILLVLDHSASMQYPAYIECDFNAFDNNRADCGISDSIFRPEDRYDPAYTYYGYFVTDKYYRYDTNKFVEDDTCTDSDNIGSPGCISGNLLNWATMSRIDLLRKALIGGKSVSLQTNAHTLRAEGGWYTYTDYDLGCAFKLSGGSYPQLDHEVSIGNAGPCGFLHVEANGSVIFGTSDSFRYIYQSVTGDFDAQLRVVKPPHESEQTFAKAGLMVRTGINADSQHVKAMVTYGSGLQFSHRLTDASATELVGGYVYEDYPIWVRIVRVGDIFTYYYSSDGSTWTMHGSSTLTMPNTVLIGMASSSYSSGTLGTAEYDEFICDVCNDDDFNDQSFDTGIWTAQDINTSIAGSQSEGCTATCPLGTLAASGTQVDVPKNERKGIIQNLSDTDYDGNWDENAPRFGLMIFAGDDREGAMKVGIEGSNASSFLTALQSEPPYGGSPAGEALREAYDYYTQVENYLYEDNTQYIGGPGSVKDPMYANGAALECRKNFVLLISDGEWNGSVDPVIPARENHVEDIRPDIEGMQNIATYTVLTFNNATMGRSAMQQTAMYGAFDDYDENSWPYNRTGYPADSRGVILPAAPCLEDTDDGNCLEWDKTGNNGEPDGLPDNYYEASEGTRLESTLIKAIEDILSSASSGTAVSVLATTGAGEGAVYQAYFYPVQYQDLIERTWLGYLHALFVDDIGNLREDTVKDDVLNMTEDLIIEMEYTAKLGTLVHRFADSDGDGIKDSTTPVSTSPLDSIKSVWNGGESLWAMNPNTRWIFTTTDGFTPVDFDTVAANPFRPYLRAADDTESTNIINWVRGYDHDDTPLEYDFLTFPADAGHPEGYRQRSITITDDLGVTATHVWKLGDIVYSTPTVVGEPMEQYDMLYNDVSYARFYGAERNRRMVVYTGANDGMLHAFNAGFYIDSKHKFCGAGYDDVTKNCVGNSPALGEELWAFIPRGLLPHLKWLTDPNYVHVYYADLKPKVTDVKIFDVDATHTEGWGTILIGGFRYGGDDISWISDGTDYSASPEYYALDITDPLHPRLLWTFSDPELGLSMSYPSVAKIGDNWYAIFGSGATEFNEDSDLTAFQNGNLFILKLSGGNNGVITSWNPNINSWKKSTGNATSFMANPITVDVDIDYDVDVAYIGENYFQSNKWNAEVQRYTTARGTMADPSLWASSVLADIDSIGGVHEDSRKITSAPSAAMDDKANLWVFFGSGQFFGESDKNHNDTGAFYAVKDKCWTSSCASASNFLDVSQAVVTLTSGNISITGTSGGGGCSVGGSSWTDLLNAVENDTCNGWALYYDHIAEGMDFSSAVLNHAGERNISKPLVAGGLVAWGSYIPGENACEILGESNAYAVYYKTGTAYKDYTFERQKETAPADGGAGGTDIARTSFLGKGMPSSPSAKMTKEGKLKIYFQQSTGAILTVSNKTPNKMLSEVAGWKSSCIE